MVKNTRKKAIEAFTDEIVVEACANRYCRNFVGFDTRVGRINNKIINNENLLFLIMGNVQGSQFIEIFACCDPNNGSCDPNCDPRRKSGVTPETPTTESVTAGQQEVGTNFRLETHLYYNPVLVVLTSNSRRLFHKKIIQVDLLTQMLISQN